jgi:hypothetical protein
MKKYANSLREMFVAGLIFLLPLLVLFVILNKVFQALTGFTTKIAALFGLKSFVGISGATLVSSISLILFCLLCGYLVRISFFKLFSKWADKKLASVIPGYKDYREMAMAKLEPKEEILPYKTAAWMEENGRMIPCFVMETTDDGKCIAFVPLAGNAKEGRICMCDTSKLLVINNADLKEFRNSINDLGKGLFKYTSA